MANTDIQKRAMYLFERVGEPLFLGPRGTSNYLYNIPNLDQQQAHASTTIRGTYTGMQDVSIRIQNVNTVQVANVQPNGTTLSNASRLCPRSTIFSYFVPNHRQAAQEIRNLMTQQQNVDSFIAMACACRDSTMVNTDLWVYAFASACLTRRDMRGFRMPALYEILPSSFFDPSVLHMAQTQAALPAQDRRLIEIPRNFTGQDNNPEQALAYYREDLGINSHHWHWHLIYTDQAPRDGPGSRNRKGELFYYMHHSMLSRYDAERICNGMPVTVPLDFTQRVPEGYFPKLTDTNSGRIWGSRQENTMLQGVNRPELGLNTSPDQIRQWYDRISEAIDTGVVLGANNQRMPLTAQTGIDILGDIVENGGIVAPNDRYYGNLHNMGHILLAFSHDPVNRHSENSGVMGDPATAMRDPGFYRWHKYVDDIFDKYKQTLQPYTPQELGWQGIRVTNVQVQTPNQRENILVTHWTQSDVDLARGMDFGRNAATTGAVWARFTHLNHERFTYSITVNNGGRQAVSGTVRIFMAPRNNERGQRLAFRDQRLLFFEMDKFTTQLQPGNNQISRRSQDSTLIIPWAQTFRDLEGLNQDPMNIQAAEAVCGCGWPEHMLLPRGSVAGILFDVFVMVTNGADDTTARQRNDTEAQRRGCKDAVAYCGILDELYPDRKAMGFPFDRNATAPGTRTPVTDLDAFIPANSNMMTRQVRIVHVNRTTIRPGGAPSNMGRLNGTGQPMPPAENATARPNTTTTTPTTQPAPTTNTGNRRPSGGQPQPGQPQPGRNQPAGGGNPRPGQPPVTFNPSRQPSPPRGPPAQPPRTPSPPSWTNWGWGGGNNNNNSGRSNSPNYFWGDE